MSSPKELNGSFTFVITDDEDETAAFGTLITDDQGAGICYVMPIFSIKEDAEAFLEKLDMSKAKIRKGKFVLDKENDA